MKRNKTQKLTILLFILLLGGIQSVEAQFLKELAKKAEEKIEREAERRAQKRVDKKIDEVFDKAENTIDGKNKKKEEKKEEVEKNEEKKTANDDVNEKEILDIFSNTDVEASLPNSYNFDWKYAVKIESDQVKKKDAGDIKMIYYLKSNASYIAIKPSMGTKSSAGDMLMIMDSEADVNLMLMNVNGQKMRMAMPNQNIEENIDDVIEDENDKNYKVVKIDSKVILGYPCQGFRIETDEGIVKTYVAKNPPISFNGIFKGDEKFKPKGFDPRWLKEFENGLMMEMQYTSNKKKKENMKMICVELKKESFSVNMSEYKSFGAAR